MKISKKSIKYLVIGLIAILIISLIVFITIRLTSSKTNKEYKTKKITLHINNDNFEDNKIIEIEDKNKIKELNQICNNINLEKNNENLSLAIRNDIKLDLNNGVIFFMQKDYDKYCFIINSNKNMKKPIQMPEGLMEYVNTIIEENS